jgi:hypothetical protein
MKHVSCNKCKWVHFEVSLDYCKKWEDEWKTYYKNLNAEGKKAYGLKSAPKIEDEYLNCSRCNNTYTDFHDSTDDEVPNGSTIGPILNRQESL